MVCINFMFFLYKDLFLFYYVIDMLFEQLMEILLFE